jgi:steroid delta-isomerase-like uncharacterized protein
MTLGNGLLESNKRIVHRFMDECWNGGSKASLTELISPRCRHNDPVFPHMHPGPDSVERHIENSRRAFPDLRFTIADTIAEGTEVVIHWTAVGTHKADFLGIPPTGRTAHISGTSIFRIEDDKIVEDWANWNLMSLMEQLGVKNLPHERVHVGWE